MGPVTGLFLHIWQRCARGGGRRQGGACGGGEGRGRGGGGVDLIRCPGYPAAAYRSLGRRRRGTGSCGRRGAVRAGANAVAGELPCNGDWLPREEAGRLGGGGGGGGQGGVMCCCCAAVVLRCAGPAGSPACPGLACWLIPPISYCLRIRPATMTLIFLFGPAPSTAESLLVPTQPLVVWLWRCSRCCVGWLRVAHARCLLLWLAPWLGSCGGRGRPGGYPRPVIACLG